MTLQIAPYRDGDEIQVAQLIARCFEAAIAPDYDDDGVRAFAAYIDPAAIARRQREDCLLLAARKSGVCVGAIECRKLEHISLFFVAPECWRNGIGRMLLERLLKLLARLNPELERLTVYSSPYAVGVYRRLGFEADADEQCVNGIRYTPMSRKLPRPAPPGSPF